MRTLSNENESVNSAASATIPASSNSTKMSSWPELDVEDLISKLTLEEKIKLLSGRDFWHTNPIPRLSIPSIRLSDGPNGVRGTRFFNSVPSACLPCGTALAATFDPELLRTAGKLVSKEAKAKGAHVVLGPTVNIQRSPLGGRGFESFSEDPFLSGICASHIISGMQSEGVGACIKHFVCNDQEHERQSCSSEVSERAMREVYLRPFEMAIQRAESKPMAVMTAYNRVNGKHASESKWLVNGILREEWKYEGGVMSDWYGTYSTVEALEAGLDLEMPGPTAHRGKLINMAISCQKLRPSIVDDRVRCILNLINNVRESGVPENADEGQNDNEETSKILRKIASEAIVLLKNDDDVLPFKKDKSVAVIGPNGRVARFCGGGSASLRPYYAVTPFQGIRSAVNPDVDVKYTLGAAAHKALPLVGKELTAPNGNTGFVLNFYKEPPEDTSRVPVDTIYLDDSNVFLVDYKNPALRDPVYYVDFEGTLTPEEDVAYQFGLTVHGTAKLYVNGEMLVDNATKQRQGDSFFGVGTAEEIGSMQMKAGKSYEVLVQFASGPTSKLHPPGTTVMGSGGFRVGGAAKLSHADEIKRAVQLAKEVDQVVLCVGLNADYESEGFDRPDTSLPEHTDELIDAVLSVNNNAAVVIQSGTPVTPSPSCTWPAKVRGILQAWYGGNETGNAIADVLFGDVNPSGRLPLTFPKRCEDNPSFLNFGAEKGKVYYGEGVFVGYKYYGALGSDVWYKFGDGMSYTSFSLDKLKVEQKDDQIRVEVEVKNTGSKDGAEVVQVYIAPRTSSVRRPVKELKGVGKVFLKTGHSEKVEIAVDTGFACSYWDELEGKWCMEKGVYDVIVSENNSDHGKNVLKGEIEVKETSWGN